MIPFKKLNFSGAKEEIISLLNSGFIGLGNKVFELEQLLAEYLSCRYVIATDSCTSALFISLIYENKNNLIGNGYAIIPSMTVPLVGNAIIEAGCGFHFSDDTEWVGSAYQLKPNFVFDSAHQLERDQLKNIGEKDKYCFSFYPTKPIGSADGGAIATNDTDFADWARSVITYGRNQKQKYQNSWDYETERLGYKRHYTNLQSVICIEQLKRLDETNYKRIKIRNRFNEAFGLNNKSLYLYRINVENRDKFIEEMKAEGIECGVHYKPLHLMNAFKKFKFEYLADPGKVEEAYEHTVSIPFYESLTENEIEFIIKKVSFAIEKRITV